MDRICHQGGRLPDRENSTDVYKELTKFDELLNRIKHNQKSDNTTHKYHRNNQQQLHTLPNLN